MNPPQKTSFLELSKKSVGLRALTTSEVHFSSEGVQALSEVEETHFWFTERRRLILKLLHHFVPAASLGIDVGCGSGFNAVWLSENGLPTVGVDAHDGFRAYQSKGRGNGFIQGDIFSAEPEPEFDFLLMLDVLEHIEQDRNFFAQAGKMLKPGGIALVTVPAFQYLWSEVDERGGHLRRYKKSDLTAYTSLDKTRLELLYSSYFFATTLPLFFLTRKFNVKKGAQKRGDDIEKPPGPLINTALKALLRVEGALMPYVSLPFGSSLFAIFRKSF